MRILTLSKVAHSAARNTARSFCTARKSKLVRETWSFLSDIAGNPALAGKEWRVSTGEILKLMDLAAASSAIMHIGHGRLNTLAFDHLESVTPIFHGDQVQVDCRVVHVGTSTVTVHCVGRKRDLPSRGWIHTHEGLVVYVALGPDGRPEAAPELVCETASEQRFREMVIRRLELGKQYSKEQSAILASGADAARAADAAGADGRKHRETVDIDDTLLQCVPRRAAQPALPDHARGADDFSTRPRGRVRRIFMPRNLNALGTIFGGDLLEWMEAAAVTCARQFLRNPGAVSIAMDRVFFFRPIRPDQLADLCAHVVLVKGHTVQVVAPPPPAPPRPKANSPPSSGSAPPHLPSVLPPFLCPSFLPPPPSLP